MIARRVSLVAYLAIGGTLTFGGISIFQWEWWIAMTSAVVIDIASHMGAVNAQ